MSKLFALERILAHDPNGLCQLCSNHLSVGPIYYVYQIGSICGRCTWKARIICDQRRAFTKQPVLEAFLKRFYFQCCNKTYGCKQILKWNEEVLQHENECSYRNEICPLNFDCFNKGKCSWFGKSEEFVEHVETTHAHLIRTEKPFQLLLKRQGRNSINFLRLQSQLVTIVIAYVEQNVFHCLVMLHGTKANGQCYSVNLKLYDKYAKSYLKLRRDRVEPLRNMVEGMFLKLREDFFRVDFNAMAQMLKFDETILIQFDIKKKSIPEVDLIKKTMSEAAFPNPLSVPPKVSKNMECVKCGLFIMDEIYKCLQNHLLCKNCLSTDCCAICGYEMQARVSVFENLLATVFPCTNYIRGCTFTLMNRGVSIEEHEQTCTFQMLTCNDCQLVCPLKSFNQHWQEYHQRYLSDLETSLVVDSLSLEQWYTHLIKLNNNLFVLVYRVNISKFEYAVTSYNFESVRYSYILQMGNPGKEDVVISLPGMVIANHSRMKSQNFNVFKINPGVWGNIDPKQGFTFVLKLKLVK